MNITRTSLTLMVVALALVLAACTPAYVRDTIQANSPGAQILSAEQGIPAAGEPAGELWCVVSQNGGVKTRWLVRQVESGDSTLIMNFKGAAQEHFTKYGCTNWDG